MNILALDLGTTTGWAISDRNGKITGGSISFQPRTNERAGQKWLRFRLFLAELGTTPGVDIVYYEEVCRHVSVKSSHAYGGFKAMLEAWCAANNVLMVGIGVGTIKKSWTGNGAAKKPEMIAEAVRRGFKPVCDNHADALALLAYAVKAEGVVSGIAEPGPAALFAEAA